MSTAERTAQIPNVASSSSISADCRRHAEAALWRAAKAESPRSFEQTTNRPPARRTGSVHSTAPRKKFARGRTIANASRARAGLGANRVKHNRELLRRFTKNYAAIDVACGQASTKSPCVSPRNGCRAHPEPACHSSGQNPLSNSRADMFFLKKLAHSTPVLSRLWTTRVPVSSGANQGSSARMRQ
jgi:hypothetical protein